MAENPSQHPRGSVHRLAVRLSRWLQVKRHGQYSLARIRALNRYSRAASALRAVAVVACSALPSLALCAVVDALPLSPPRLGLAHNRRFVARFLAMTLALSCLTMQEFRANVRSLPLSTTRMLVASVAVSLGSTAVFYLLARRIGFPLPYSMIMTSEIAWVPLLVASALATWGKAALWENEHNRRQVLTLARIWGSQAFLSAIYPLYVFVLLNMTGSLRLAVMLVVPVMKVVVRAAFSSTLSHLGDDTPVAVTLGADVFNSLFLTYAMQTTALSAIVGLMAIDVLYLGVCLRDMDRQIQEIHAIQLELDADEGRRAKAWPLQADALENSPSERLSMLERADQLIARYSKLKAEEVVHCCSTRRVEPLETAVAPIRPPESTNMPSSQTEATDGGEEERLLGKASPLERRYVASVSRFLFSMEYVLLLNFIEACTPLIYASFMVLGFCLPNREFYAQLEATKDAADLGDALANITLYASVQFATLTLVSLAYSWHAKISGLQQLAFVLERQRSAIQTKLVFWVFYNAQASLTHFGYDYTFRFAWLRSTSPPPP